MSAKERSPRGRAVESGDGRAPAAAKSDGNSHGNQQAGPRGRQRRETPLEPTEYRPRGEDDAGGGNGAASVLGPTGIVHAADSPLDEYLLSSRRLQHRSHTRQKLKLLRLEVIGLAAIALIGALIGGLVLLRLSIDNNRLGSRVAALQSEVAVLGGHLTSVTAERDRLVQGRHPSLHGLLLDHKIPLAEHYVRDIIFTRVGRGEEVRYEFRAVLENDGLLPLVPAVSVLLFDALGVQIGRSDLDPAEASRGGVLLEAGEVRVYHGEVTAALDGPPVYFRVIAR